MSDDLRGLIAELRYIYDRLDVVANKLASSFEGIEYSSDGDFLVAFFTAEGCLKQAKMNIKNALVFAQKHRDNVSHETNE